MKDANKTKEQLIKEMAKLRRQIAELKKLKTERKRAEEVRLASSYARSLIEASLDPLVTISLNGKIMDVNEATVRVTGVSREKLIGSDFSDYFTDPERARAGYREVFKKGFVLDYSLDLKHRDGHLTPVLYNASVYRDEKGEVIGVFAAARDITERKRMEEALRGSEIKFKRLYDSNIIGIIFWDTAGNISRANNEFLRIVGYTQDDVLQGKVRWKDMTPPEYAYLDEKALKEMAETGVSVPFEKKYIRKDGSLVPVIIGAVLFKEQKDVGICFVLDISERKRAEEQLKKTLENLARSNKELEQFAYIASHDLQEPLRMVASFTQLLEKRYKGKLDGDADEYIKFAVDGASRMQRLINDLLTYSRIGTRGKPFEPCDCQFVLGQVIVNLKTMIDENNALITNDDLPTIMADETQMIQLFQNLIGNAIKFRRKEPPQVHISAEQKLGEWIFSVRDNGIGIDQQYKERIFVIFQRLHSKDEYGGTGIGLAICKRIVERHGGRIWIESEPGEGSTFYWTIPKRPITPTPILPLSLNVESRDETQGEDNGGGE